MKRGRCYIISARRGADFGTRVQLTVDPKEKLTEQKLVAPRIPIVRTTLETDQLRIVEEAFAVKTPDREARENGFDGGM